MKPATTRALFAAMALAVLVTITAVSSQSLWIDEGGSAFKAMQPTLAQWWHSMVWDPSTNLQLPLYLLVLWGWDKVFGSSEVAMRLCNIPFILLTVYSIWLAFRAERRRFWCGVALVLTNAFIWFYLDEARPYMLLLAGSSLLFASVYRLKQDPEAMTSAWAWMFLAGAVLVCATSMIAVPWAASAFLAAWYWRGRLFPWEFLRRFPIQFLLLCAALAGLGLYYLSSFKNRDVVPNSGTTGLANLAFMIYDLFGFSGLGPSRNVMRVQLLHAFHGYYAPLAIYGCLWLAVVLSVIRKPAGTQARKSLIFYSIYLFPVVLVLLIGHFHHVRILPRYVTPSFAVIVCLGSYAAARLWACPPTGRLLVATLFLTAFISSAEIRFMPRHAKDDYRSACAVARKDVAQGRTVFWDADSQTAIYYGLLRNSEFESGSSQVILLGAPGFREALPKADVIVLSKKDLYDQDGSIANYAQENHFVPAEQFESFQFWRKVGLK